MFDTAPADLAENNGFMSCFQMFDRIHDGYSKAHGRGFQFTPGHVCISCADVLYYILRQSAIFVKLAAMRQVKKWSISPCAMWSKVCVPLPQILHCAAILQCEAFFHVPKGTLNSKKHSFIRQTKECFSVACPMGFEPMTFRVGVWHSIRLSYGHISSGL